MLQIGKPAGVRGRWALPTLLVLVSLLNACRDNPSLPLPQDPTPPYPAYGTPFGGVPDTRDMVMYEVNLRAYSSAGNIQGVINRLDSIKLLGVNVLWLMPLHPVGVLKGINSPYCVRDYKAVGAEYGTLEDLRSLTDAAHARGMAVLMDWVANHTAWDHPWMANDGWYTQNNQGQVVHPPGTNWLDVADLNYSNQAMRDAMLDAMLYWIYQANIDGFRCDYADGVPFDFWETAWARLRSIPGRRLILFAEGSRSDHFQADFDLNFGWSTYNALKQVWQGQSPSVYLNARLNQSQSTPPTKAWLQFTTNHDESAWDATPMVLFGGQKGALAASAVSLMGGGPQLLYGSQEVGIEQNLPFFSRQPIPWNQNQPMQTAYRRLMAWYQAHPSVRYGSTLSYPHPDLVCIQKQVGSDTTLALINVRNRAVTFNVPPALRTGPWTCALAGPLNSPAPSGPELLPANITLQPYEGRFFER